MINNKIRKFFASKLFFLLTIGLLIISSLWLALGSIYPMAFDEEVHYGITQIYAENINPFAVQQTEAANKFGAIETDPSYLFYYALSFPYRLLAAVNDSQVFIVTGLRLINIALFVGAFFLYRKLFLQIGISRALTHVCLALVSLIPIAPMLAAQINYDNLIFLVIPLLTLGILRVRTELQKGEFAIQALLLVIVLALLGSIVKYAFLPIAAGAGLYTLGILIHAIRKHRLTLASVKRSWIAVSLPVKVGLVLLVVLSTVLFSQRYVRNIAVYGELVPDCAAVLSIDECKAWGPWGRDYALENAKTGTEEIRSLPHYTATHWAWGMWKRLFFTLGGPTNDYATRKELPIPSITFIVLMVVSGLAFLYAARRLFRQYPAFVLFTSMTALYVGALLAQEYANYIQTAMPVAINGRYLLLLAPFVAVMLGTALMHVSRRLKVAKYMPGMAIVILILFLQGGGVITYVIRSESNWLYNNAAIHRIDHILKTTLRPVIFGD